MDPPNVNPDIEAQPNNITDSQSAIIPNPPLTGGTANPPPQDTNTNEPYRDNGNSPTQQTSDISEVQRGMLVYVFHKLLSNLRRVPDENHGYSSDGLGSMYLTGAEKQDAEVSDSWKIRVLYNKSCRNYRVWPINARLKPTS